MSVSGTEKILDFCVNTISGFERFVMESLRINLPGAEQFQVESDRRHGRVFFRYTRTPTTLLDLTPALSTLGVVSRIGGITVGSPGLDRISEGIRRADIKGARRLVKVCNPEVDVDRFEVSCTIGGRHRFSRKDVNQVVRNTLRYEHGLESGNGQPCLRFRVRILDSKCIFFVQLGQRRHPGGPSEGLSDVMVSSLQALLELRREDVVLCLNCQDEAVAALAVASAVRCRENISLASGIEVKSCAREIVSSFSALPFLGQSISCVLDGSTKFDVNDRLNNFADALVPGGIAVIVFGDFQAIATTVQARELPLDILAVLPIYIRGRSFKCCVIERLDLVSDNRGILELQTIIPNS